MASLSRQKNGRYRLDYFGPDGKRRTIRPGKISQRNAERLKTHVELMLERNETGDPFDADTKAWLEAIDNRLHAKLATVGLVPSREKPDEKSKVASNSQSLDWYLGYYFSIRTDAKESTRISWAQAKRLLFEFFGKDKPIDEITEGDADEWRSFLKSKLAETTTRKRCGQAKQMFGHAKKKGFIETNPFAHLKSASKSNPTRYYFLSRKDTEKVLEACPDASWRLLVALARYGGLRIPSEPILLKWEDVNWELGRITITSPKTEHHEGGESRVIPLFPELRPYLEDQLELTGSEVFVLPTAIRAHTNLGTMLRKIIKRAGLKLWPKIWQNLRSTRQTELSEQFPAHVVCAWIGNSEDVAKLHYLQVTDDHFARAIENPPQNPPRQAPETPRNSLKVFSTEDKKTPVFPRVSSDVSHFDPLRNEQMVPTGLEPVTSTL